MDKTLGDKIPEFNRKSTGGGNVGLSGASFSLGDHRSKLEVLAIALICRYKLWVARSCYSVFSMYPTT